MRDYNQKPKTDGGTNPDKARTGKAEGPMGMAKHGKGTQDCSKEIGRVDMRMHTKDEFSKMQKGG